MASHEEVDPGLIREKAVERAAPPTELSIESIRAQREDEVCKFLSSRGIMRKWMGWLVFPEQMQAIDRKFQYST